jgi:hypothetical protein
MADDLAPAPLSDVVASEIGYIMSKGVSHVADKEGQVAADALLGHLAAHWMQLVVLGVKQTARRKSGQDTTALGRLIALLAWGSSQTASCEASFSLSPWMSPSTHRSRTLGPSNVKRGVPYHQTCRPVGGKPRSSPM